MPSETLTSGQSNAGQGNLNKRVKNGWNKLLRWFDSAIETRSRIGRNQFLRVKVWEHLKSAKIKGYRWEGTAYHELEAQCEDGERGFLMNQNHEMINVLIHCSLKSAFSINNMFKLNMYQESMAVKLEFQKNNHFRVSTQSRHETSWNDISYTLGAPEGGASRSPCSGADIGWRSHSSPSSQVEEHQNLPQDRVGNWRTLDKRVGGAEWSPAP